MQKHAIVVVAYNRTKSLLRLLNSLEKAEYGDSRIDLVISIDKSDNPEVLVLAKDFKWKYGEKEVVEHQSNLGLRKHILKCGEFLEKYEAIAVLEDDIYVSPDFYNYMIQAVDFYQDDYNIAGISLYSHLWAESHKRPFNPAFSNYDTYFLQLAQSWGQIWMRKQWQAFIKWYEENKSKEFTEDYIPNNIRNWPQTSWLKYHIKYCVEMNKFFVYPYKALSTNFTEVGEHNSKKSTSYQVPLVYSTGKKYSFNKLELNGDLVKYDVFLERIGLSECLGVREEDLCVNIYGGKSKSQHKRYLLTTKMFNYKVVKAFGLELRPQEMNVLCNVPGDAIYLYDTTIVEKNVLKKNDYKEWFYDNRNPNYRVMVRVLIEEIKLVLKNGMLFKLVFNKIFK